MNIQRNDVIAYYPSTWYGRVVTNLSGKYSHISVAASDVLEVTTLPITGVYLKEIQLQKNFDIYRLKPRFELSFLEVRAWNWITHLLEEQTGWKFINRLGKYSCNKLVSDFFLTGGFDLIPKKPAWKCNPTEMVKSRLLVQVG